MGIHLCGKMPDAGFRRHSILRVIQMNRFCLARSDLSFRSTISRLFRRCPLPQSTAQRAAKVRNTLRRLAGLLIRGGKIQVPHFQGTAASTWRPGTR